MERAARAARRAGEFAADLFDDHPAMLAAATALLCASAGCVAWAIAVGIRETGPELPEALAGACVLMFALSKIFRG